MGIEQVSGQGNVPVPSPSGQTTPRSPAPAVSGGGGSASIAPDTQQKPAPNLKQVQEAIQQVQRAVQSHASNLQFSVDKESGETIVKVVDTQTNEVIRQIPSEEMLSIAHSIDQQLQGVLLKQKA